MDLYKIVFNIIRVDNLRYVFNGWRSYCKPNIISKHNLRCLCQGWRFIARFLQRQRFSREAMQRWQRDALHLRVRQRWQAWAEMNGRILVAAMHFWSGQQMGVYPIPPMLLSIWRRMYGLEAAG